MPLRTLLAATIAAITGSGEKRRYSFVRMDIGSPVGTKRFTDYPESTTVTLNVDGSLSAINVTSGGSGYSSAPAVAIAAPPAGGTQATAIATIAAGAVTGVTITNAGAGYLTAPAVSFSGGGGSGAAATAVVQQVWTKFGIKIGRIGQDRGGVESVSWIELPNADTSPTISGWARSPGLKLVRVRIWDVYFNTAVIGIGSMIESVMNYDGKISNQSHGLVSRLALIPHGASWVVEGVPYATPQMMGAGDLIGTTQRDIQWGDLIAR
jgi:hypothetical protein